MIRIADRVPAPFRLFDQGTNFMSMSSKWMAGIALSSVLLTGCVSKVTEQEQYSGFLPNYEGLQETTSPSGQKVLRWVAPGFKPEAYSTVVFDQLELYPEPKPTDRVSLSTLKDLQFMANESTRNTLAQQYKVVSSAKLAPEGSRTLIMHAAITEVSASNEPMHWYEAVPIAAIVGTTQVAMGTRDQIAELYIEADLIDAKSGLPVAKMVRKVFGEGLENSDTPITAKDFKAAFKTVSADMQALLSKQ